MSSLGEATTCSVKSGWKILKRSPFMSMPFPFSPTPAELLNETRPTTKHTSAFIQSAQPDTTSLSHTPLTYRLPQPATHVVSNNDSNQFGVRMAFSTACDGKMCTVGMGYGIGMDASSCRDRWTPQDSITDLAPHHYSPFASNHRIFVNLCSNCKAIGARHLKRWLAHTNAQAYLRQTDSVLISISMEFRCLFFFMTQKKKTCWGSLKRCGMSVIYNLSNIWLNIRKGLRCSWGFVVCVFFFSMLWVHACGVRGAARHSGGAAPGSELWFCYQWEHSSPRWETDRKATQHSVCIQTEKNTGAVIYV